MSASRLFSLFVSLAVHNRASVSAAPPNQFNKLFPSLLNPPFLRFRRYSSSAGTITATKKPEEKAAGNCSDSHHPWPEWVAFIDRLKAKGYLAQDNGNSGADGNIYKDMNLLKDATLSFARDHFHIFKSLSNGDIRAVVESGCPNLFRKAVNSAKRLRAHVRLDEGDVCSDCNLRESCDKAYVILKESEAAARTVDMVRILLFYALDPIVVTGGETLPSRALVDASARNLLSELTLLSETSPHPGLSKPAAQASPQEKWPRNNVVGKDVEMKRGDTWPRSNVVGKDVEMKRGDWMCPQCNFMNFARNIRCLKCNVEGPKRVGVDDVGIKKGDWNCPKCSFMNFASNRKCLRCKEARPKRQLNPGDWECPSCDFVNFRRNAVCLKCNCEHTSEVATQYEEQIWRAN